MSKETIHKQIQRNQKVQDLRSMLLFAKLTFEMQVQSGKMNQHLLEISKTTITSIKKVLKDTK